MRKRQPPDAAMVAEQLAGQRPNVRSSHVFALADTDHGVKTVAINRRESPLMSLYHAGEIADWHFAAAMRLRSIFERSIAAPIKAQAFEIIATKGGAGERTPSAEAEDASHDYALARRALMQPHLAFKATKLGTYVFPWEILAHLVEQHAGIRAIEDRFRIPHGEGRKRIRACLTLLDDYFEGRLPGATARTPSAEPRQGGQEAQGEVRTTSGRPKRSSAL